MTPSVIITMAGKGSRFSDAGYKTPKHLIKAKGRPLIEWSLISLKSFFKTWQFVFIALKARNDVPTISNYCKVLGISKYVVHEIDTVTAGQAETAKHAKKYVDGSSPILIYNIDTFVEPGHINPDDFGQFAGFLHVFKAPGDHWSFIGLDDVGRVTAVKEKTRISDLCSIGTYFFNSFDLFEATLDSYRQDISSELYLAPMYNYLLAAENGGVGFKVIDSQYVYVLGTPAEVEKFDSEVRQNNE